MSNNDLKQAIWSAAGWGSYLCEICRHHKIRLVGPGGSYVTCGNNNCPSKQEKEQEDEF